MSKVDKSKGRGREIAKTPALDRTDSRKRNNEALSPIDKNNDPKAAKLAVESQQSQQPQTQLKIDNIFDKKAKDANQDAENLDDDNEIHLDRVNVQVLTNDGADNDVDAEMHADTTNDSEEYDEDDEERRGHDSRVRIAMQAAQVDPGNLALQISYMAAVVQRSDFRTQKIDRRLSSQEKRLADLETLTDTVKETKTTVETLKTTVGSNVTDLQGHEARIQKLETVVKGQTKVLQGIEKATRLDELERAAKEVKVMGIPFNDVVGNDRDDFPNTDKLCDYLWDSGKLGQPDVGIIGSVQLGRAKPFTDGKGNEKPRSAPVVLKFREKKGRDKFWAMAVASKDKLWYISDSDQPRHQHTATMFRNKAKSLRKDGCFARINIKKDNEVGFRYQVQTRKRREDDWEVYSTEKMDWQEA